MVSGTQTEGLSQAEQMSSTPARATSPLHTARSEGAKTLVNNPQEGENGAQREGSKRGQPGARRVTRGAAGHRVGGEDPSTST